MLPEDRSLYPRIAPGFSENILPWAVVATTHSGCFVHENIVDIAPDTVSPEGGGIAKKFQLIETAREK
jgi:hypothetical protein